MSLRRIVGPNARSLVFVIARTVLKLRFQTRYTDRRIALERSGGMMGSQLVDSSAKEGGLKPPTTSSSCGTLVANPFGSAFGLFGIQRFDDETEGEVIHNILGIIILALLR
jgi:hypothetical protein